MLIQEVRKLSPYERLYYWIQEREKVRQKKEKGDPKPWTDDVILQSYRFCNVYREYDKVTKWIAANWREPNSGHIDNWFAMAVARWCNWPDTLEELGYPVPWDPKKFIKVVRDRTKRDQKVWTGAYMIGTQGNKTDKPVFIADYVLTPLWNQRANLRPRSDDTLREFADRIVNIKNQGRFMVGQIVADIKYDKKGPLYSASDWHTYAISGPGSRRGLNRVLGRPVDAPWTEKEWYKQLMILYEVINTKIEISRSVEPIHAQDLQNCLCEGDKYVRVLNGEGKPRSSYNGRE